MIRVMLLSMLGLMSISPLFAQMEENGTAYIKHPAIEVVKSLNKALVAGDSAKIISLLTDDFKAYNGVSTNPDPDGTNKENFVKGALKWSRELDYYDVKDFPGSYPDAIKYDKDNEYDKVWVQTWDMITGVHKKTGVKFSSPGHRLFRITKDNKIETVISYFNENIFDEQAASYTDRRNGTIFDSHANINTVRKMMYAIEYGDMDKSYSFYHPDVKFYDINKSFGEPMDLEGKKEFMKHFGVAFEIKAIEMIGYPDYLEYERSNSRAVLSWWNVHLVRKSDDKEIQMVLHLNDSFDADGMITDEIIYYSQSLLEQE